MSQTEISRIIPVTIVAANLYLNEEIEYDDSGNTGITVAKEVFSDGGIGAKILRDDPSKKAMDI
jgi:hypothetical protein